MSAVLQRYIYRGDRHTSGALLAILQMRMLTGPLRSSSSRSMSEQKKKSIFHWLYLDDRLLFRLSGGVWQVYSTAIGTVSQLPIVRLSSVQMRRDDNVHCARASTPKVM